MSLTANMIERIAEWCAHSDALGDIRSRARGEYFGYDEPGEVRYLPGVENLSSRERRFLGWFVFSFRLADGKHPSELAAAALLKGQELVAALKAVQSSKYVLAMVAMVSPGRGMILKLEDEEFELPSRQLSHIFKKGDTICTHIIPIGRGKWLPGPGWFLWPFRVMPGMQANLKSFQLSPLDIERFLQQRRAEQYEEGRKVEYPRDATLNAAVARLTQAAESEGREKLIMPAEEWKRLVLSYIMRDRVAEFGREVAKRVGEVESVEDLNKWLALAMNIWNTTPQPDRGDKSAYELGRQDDKKLGE